MTETIEIIRTIMNNIVYKWVLDQLLSRNMRFQDLLELNVYSSKEIVEALKYLDHVAVIDNVFDKKTTFFSISARGRKIAEIIKGD